MRKNTVLLVIVILFVGILLTTIYLSYNRNLRYVDFGNEDSTTKICLIAGVHGNEPAGSLLLSYLVDTTYFKDVCDTLILLHHHALISGLWICQIYSIRLAIDRKKRAR